MTSLRTKQTKKGWNPRISWVKDEVFLSLEKVKSHKCIDFPYVFDTRHT